MEIKLGVILFVFGATTVAVATAQQGEPFKCPHEYGFYPHPRSCDKYFKCENSVSELKTCGNGLAFDSTDSKFLAENCDYLHNVDCGERTELEPPISSANCPRLYGIFPDEVRCDTFWSCWNGESNKYTCAPGLAYDREARVCMWADQVPECKVTETEGGFKCPNPKENPNPGATFSRHAHPDDCRKYYICLDSSPREYGCPIGTVYQIGSDPFSGQCADPEGVEGCENYYGDDLKGIRKSELLLGGVDNSGSSGAATSRPITRKKVNVAEQAQSQVQAQQASRPAAAAQSRVRPGVKARPAPAPSVAATTQRPTTEAPKTAEKLDDYYYYESDEVPAQQPQGQRQGQGSSA